MSLLSIPDTPNDITPQWITEALYSTDTFPNAVVTSLCAVSQRFIAAITDLRLTEE